MKKSMLIDAAHLEETRILVLENDTIEDLDFESSTKEQLRGNIYLAKVSRVEPSLRAAFVDYGKNRHGFLPFNEIHPDYFQIPISDKQSLIAESVMSNENLDESKKKKSNKNELEEDEVSFNENTNLRQASIRRSKLYSKYKIQEVIKKRQILLIQITKEERGNKGAAITTFISLAGRYCVLMPNSSNSGGISKKIVFKTRKKMKEVLNTLNIPKEMSVILRTAGSEKSKTEIKRDYEYLFKLWQEIKNRTLKSIAPILIHEENHIIKRAIRDNFSNDLKEIIIEGEEAYKLGKSFMKTLMPSKATLVKKYKNSMPIFNNYGLEKNLDLIFKPEVKLSSGGSIVINPTEALVAIDVNSGRSTLERDIEPTAVKTNIEAAKEIAKQLRLRDLGGLIVIDFIDMNIRKNNYLVENTLKYAVKKDRAKIQIGRISSFGLLEMSRQRLRPSLLEINFQNCSYCDGTGLTRSIESQSLQIIRQVELLLKKQENKIIKLEINTSMAEYLLNNKNGFFKKNNYNGNEIIISIDNSIHSFNFKISEESQYETANDKNDKKIITNKPQNTKIKKKNKNTKDKRIIRKKESASEKNTAPIKTRKKKVEKKKVEKKSKKVIRKLTTNKNNIENKNKIQPMPEKAKIEKEIKTGWWDQ